MEDSLIIRLLKAVFKLLWKLFLNALYLLGRLVELGFAILNNVLKNYI